MSAVPRRITLPLLIAALLFAWAGCSQPPERERVVEGVGEPVWVRDAVIYEIFVPDFSEEGTFRGVIDRLDALEQMGVTTLWLMPIHPIGEERRKGVLGSPYAIKDYFAVNPEYGTKEDFRALVDSVHARDMHIIIDYVANHTAWDHPWTTERPDWYTRTEAGSLTVPVSPQGDTTDWTDVADLNYRNEALRQTMIDAMQYWVEEFDIDGYRADVAGWVPSDFWTAAIDSVEAIKPVLMLAEHDDPKIHRTGFDLTYSWPFYNRLKEVWNGAPAHQLTAQVEAVSEQLPSRAKRLRFTTNHDETAWDAPPTQLFGGVEGSKAAFVLTASMPGVPLLYNGQELAVRDTVPFFEATPYDWTQDDTLIPFYSRYLAAYRESPALRRGTFGALTPDASDVLMFTRTADTEQVLIAVNVRDKSTSVPVPAPYNEQKLTSILDSTTVATDSLRLAPYGYRLLRVETPEPTG
jgi:glycosidase